MVGKHGGARNKLKGLHKPPYRSALGWMNLKTAGEFVIQDETQTYLICTHLHNLDPSTLNLQVEHGHLLIEGYCLSPQGLPTHRIARYVHLLDLPHVIDPSYIESWYTDDSRLYIRLQKAR